MEKNIFTKNPTTLKKIWSLLVKDVALLLHIIIRSNQKKKMVKGEKNTNFFW
jgi:hypothetical protein